MLRFEWDARKARTNVAKHGVTFEEASTVFGDPLTLTVPDDRFDEIRSLTIGRSHLGRTIVVAHAERGDRIRIISARIATARERRQYEQG
ncbi:MAG TPA: BrnT family toxin [Candidatus Baltobacteraceae bacterium]|nr:BrnT family toxin [Candidatus Baltobacteraceae bacterium]